SAFLEAEGWNTASEIRVFGPRPPCWNSSLPSDIIQLSGTSSVPAIVAGSVLGVFELGERFASQRAKDALSKWLLTFMFKRPKLFQTALKSFSREFSVIFR